MSDELLAWQLKLTEHVVAELEDAKTRAQPDEQPLFDKLIATYTGALENMRNAPPPPPPRPDQPNVAEQAMHAIAAEWMINNPIPN